MVLFFFIIVCILITPIVVAGGASSGLTILFLYSRADWMSLVAVLRLIIESLLTFFTLTAEVLYVFHVHLVKDFWILATLWLEVEVNLWAFHLRLKLLLLFFLFFFGLLLFFLLFLVLLLNSKLIEYILVVKNSMRELIFEIIFVQEVGYSVLDKIDFKNLINVWSFTWVSFKHQAKKVSDVLAKVGWGVSVGTLYNLLSKLMKTLSIEGWHKSTHLIEQHTK